MLENLKIGSRVELTATFLELMQQLNVAVYDKLISRKRADGKLYGYVTSLQHNSFTLRIEPAYETQEPFVISITFPDDKQNLIPSFVNATVDDDDEDDDTDDTDDAEDEAPLSPMNFNPTNTDPVPPGVRMAQWVVNSFLQLKQYGIVQDLNRTPDSQASSPSAYDFNESWKGEDRRRAVMVKLTDEEECTYNTALARIRAMINEDMPRSHTRPETK